MQKFYPIIIICCSILFSCNNEQQENLFPLDPEGKKLLQKANSLYKQKHYKKIIDSISHTQKKHAQHYKIQLVYAKAFLKTKEYSKALQKLTKLKTTFENTKNAIPQSDKALFHSLLGYTYEKVNEYQKSIRHHLEAKNYLPNHAHSWSNLARTYYKIGNYKNAKTAYEKSYQLKADSKSTLQGLGRLAFLEANYTQAQNYYQKALKISPQSSELYFEYSKVLEKMNKQDKAHEMKAKGFYLKKLLEESLQELQYIKNLRSNLELLKINLSILIQLNKKKEAQKAINFGLKHFPQDDEFSYNKAQIPFQEGNYHKALRSIHKSLQRFPNSHSLHVLMGQTYQRLQKKEKAFKAYLRAIQIKKDDIHAREYIAQYYRMKGDNNNEFFHQGVIYYYTKDYEQAEVVLKWVTKDFKQQAQLYYYQGLIAWKKNQLTDAQELFKKAIQKDTSFSPAYLSLEKLYETKKNTRSNSNLKNLSQR